MGDEVSVFAELMRSRLQERDKKYHGKTWKDDTIESLFIHLQEEVKELTEVLQSGGTLNDIRNEAVDIANMAMMIVDVSGGLK
ncbi:hypothetical protein KAR91_26410 [Candidatus Pacearchaeota archaeon]|nr:hypothetical protein [Candidatus Pacearchaeota archaeon]